MKSKSKLFKFTNNSFIKIFLFSFLFVSLFMSFNTFVFAQSDSGNNGEQVVRDLGGLSKEGRGIMTCDPFSDSPSEQCYPKDAITLLKRLFQVALYTAIIGLWVIVLYYSIKYVYYGKSPEELAKLKKGMKYSFTAIGIIVIVYALIFGILSAAGFDKGILNFLKEAFARLDFNFIGHSYAQTIPAPPIGKDGSYINFFAGETIGTLILKVIQVLVNYIAAPAFVVATIWSGFLFVKAQGNPTELKEAKEVAVRVALGIIITASIFTVTTIILNTINDVSKKVDESITTTKIYLPNKDEICML